MLGTKDAVATVAVKDVAAARRFYEGTLGLKPTGGEDAEVVEYRSGHSTVLVYHSQFAGSNQATAVTWMVDDKVDELVRTLKAKGLEFEHYDLPNTTLRGDVHLTGEQKVAWFKDPDGNIHSLVGR
jgi:catechol 2,3-dioxygenase-like lactoylglutathione lyase family enzyme